MSEAAPRILVVEDHEDSRELLAEFLEAAGYTVEVAAHGREALERLRHPPRPDVMLLDLMMPVMSGWELMRAVSADPTLAGMPVVVVSGAGDAQPLPEGILSALPKPVDLVGLRALLAHLRRRG